MEDVHCSQLDVLQQSRPGPVQTAADRRTLLVSMLANRGRLQEAACM